MPNPQRDQRFPRISVRSAGDATNRGSANPLRYEQRNRLDKLNEGAVKADDTFAEMIRR